MNFDDISMYKFYSQPVCIYSSLCLTNQIFACFALFCNGLSFLLCWAKRKELLAELPYLTVHVSLTEHGVVRPMHTFEIYLIVFNVK